MKTYDKMANSALERINEHKTIQKRCNKIIAKIVIPTLCFVIVLSALVFSNGLFTNNQIKLNDNNISLNSTENSNINESVGYSSANEESKSNNITGEVEDSCDRLGIIIVDGKHYVQWLDAEVNSYTKGEYLGKASDYEGYYKDYADVQCDLFRSAEDDKILLIFLDNGITIVLKENSSVKLMPRELDDYEFRAIDNSN